MTLTAGKIAPSAVVIAFVGYCAWPTLSVLLSDPQKPSPRPKLPELAASLFVPTLPPPPTTNPWGGKDAAALAAAREAAKAAQLAKGSGDGTADPANSDAAKKIELPPDPLSGLKLDATLIVGGKRVAVINGHLYGLRQQVPVSGVSGPPFKVANVYPYGVLLERGGKTLGLKYANAPVRPASALQEGVEDPAGDTAGSPPTEKSPPAPAGDSPDVNGQPTKARK